ncbi:MAG TPA: TIR domain-containing protein, partial [Bacteroidota bacterium]|nr:TIR domain-containing protein [Bacteroidota bacterium]
MSKTKKNLQINSQSKRSYLSQSDVPGYGLEDALKVPRTIFENYGGKPVTPLQLAKGLDLLPTSGSFRMLCGASIAYGLTDGGYNAAEIRLQPLATRILKPLKEDDDLIAKREALLTPRIIAEFLTKYDGAPIPRDDIAANVLNEMGVPIERASSIFQLILDGAEKLGLISDIKGKKYVDLVGTKHQISGEASEFTPIDIPLEQEPSNPASLNPPAKPLGQTPNAIDQFRLRRVFITHGKDKSFVEPIKKLLRFGELEPVISIERQSVSQPVPDKVMNEMRSCGAAIIHVDAEQKLIDKEGNEQIVLNANVLIEIGGAMSLYGRRFILLVR